MSVVGVLAAIALGAVLYYAVVVDPGSEIKESYIEGILGRESVVLYRDGKEKIGVLFEDTHRQYLEYARIPKQFVNAIVAAEDNQFFHHFGIDLLGIGRAMVANLMAGRIVQGGSTITQQTAKNLFKRDSRTYKAKLKELLYALRLEYHYSKEKILEFYCNQFFVSGNGHGLGVAARYYFDKDVAELTLLENAFIAGSVKRPNYYNPFTKKTEAASERARNRAKDRAEYVLGRMYKDGAIDAGQYHQAEKEDLVFRRGKMSFALNSVIELVKDGLSTPAITDALERHGISNVSTSGVRIVTTVDKNLQEASVYSLRRNLSRLDVRLRGYEREQVQKEYASLEYKGDSEIAPEAFLFGVIEEIVNDKDKEFGIRVDFGTKRPQGLIDRQGMARMVQAYARYNKQRWTAPDEQDFQKLVAMLQPGDTVYASVRSIVQDGTLLLDLERFPKLEGGALVWRQGKIVAMAGGAENRYFNRATQAKRLMGSTFKPFLFGAALQLGWNSADLLDNRRNVFVFQGMPYFPRPDHHSPHDKVSMSWAGVQSENLAAVWLLYHLTDHLTPPRLREIATHLGMAPRTDGQATESYTSYKQRIRDTYGIVVNRDALEQAAYDRAVATLEPDFLFDGRESAYAALSELPYGLHFDSYVDDIRRQLQTDTMLRQGSAVKAGTGDLLSSEERQELVLRKKILDHNFLHLKKVYGALSAYKEYLQQRVAKQREFLSFFSDRTEESPPPEGSFTRTDAGKVLFTLEEDNEAGFRLSSEELLRYLEELAEPEQEKFWQNVLLEGVLDSRTFEQVGSQMNREFEVLLTKQPYSPDVLESVRDFRIMVGLQYLCRLGREAGVTGKLEPVLSFPLGSNVVSLIDAVRMYETLVSGSRYDIDNRDKDLTEGDDTGYGINIIDRIETPEGEVIYSAQPHGRMVFDDDSRVAVANILQNTVRYGTGRYACDTVRLTSDTPEKNARLRELDMPVPLLGKTGTANDFTNSAFLGFVPGLEEKRKSALWLDNGYTVGAYVGFDDNEPMKRTSTHITGATGALPIWSEIAEQVLRTEKVGDEIDDVDLTFNGLNLQYPPVGQLEVAVDAERGGVPVTAAGEDPVVNDAYASILSFGKYGEAGHFEPLRYFKPFWQNQDIPSPPERMAMQ